MTNRQEVSEMELEEKVNYPGEWFYESHDHTELTDEIQEASVVGLVDTDCDGMACEYILNQVYGDELFVLKTGKYQLSDYDALRFIAENTTEDDLVVIGDLAPDEEYSSFLAGISRIPAEVRIYDHHNWSWGAENSIRNVADEVVIGDGDMCAAQILQEYEYPNPTEQEQEFLEVTADHDLYLKEDPRSDHLSTLSFELEPEEYLLAVEEYGADVLEDPELEKHYENAENEAERRKEIVVDKAHKKSINGYEVAIAYGDAHQTRVGQELINQGADVVVIIKPWSKVSFRTAEDCPVAESLAKKLGGGGHKHAAGGSFYHYYESPDDVAHLDHLHQTEGEPAIKAMEEFLQQNL